LDQSKYFVTKFGTRYVSYNKRFKNTLQAGKKFRIYFGNLLKKYFKKKIKVVFNKFFLSKKNSNLFDRYLVRNVLFYFSFFFYSLGIGNEMESKQ
jgi:hypothetical protein